MADILATLQRRPKPLILTFTAFVLVAVAALQIADLWWRREQMINAAHARAGNLAFVLAEYVRGTFAVADTSLRQLAVHGRHMADPAAHAEEWTAILAAARAALPGSGSITVTDADGMIRRSTQPAIIGQSRRDQYLFQQLSTIDRDELVVDTPFLTPAPPQRFLIPIGRRLTTADGAFHGMVVATLMPETFREFFQTVDVGTDGIIWVFHPDGVVLFREPSPTDPIGDAAADHPVVMAARGGDRTGVIEGPLPDRQQVFVSAYHDVGSPPLLVAVSLSRADILADWRQQRRTSATAFGVLTLALAGVVLVLFRQIDARTRTEQTLAEVQRVEASRLRESNQRLEEALEREQRARRETEAASYLKDEFLMTVSHELRTPLTAIYGWVRMLASDAVPADERPRAVAVIERNAAAQVRLIDDLLDVSRAISGKLRIDARPVHASDVLHGVVETLRPALDAKAIHLETVVDPDLESLTADPDRLQQIVWNLLANAIKFTPDGGRVELHVSRAGPQVEIVVTDTGVGIAPEFLPFVFERFRQAESGTRRRYTGLGLGLAIVRHLVELHGGTVTAESPGEGLGSTFRVLLPFRSIRADATRPEAPAAAAALPPRLTAARLDGLRVLVVDDEPDARDLFASILDRAGARVLTAGSAGDALQLLADERPHVLLSDIEMPNEDGYQLLQRALADSRLRDLRLVTIAVTAHARTRDQRQALEAGFDWHLAKPVEPAELVSVIASLLHTPVPGRMSVS